jgi:hypothetical protein
MEYLQATMSDLAGVKALLAKYHRDTIASADLPDGFVTTKLSDTQFEELIAREDGITLAKDGERIAAFAFAAGWDFWLGVPIMKRMTEVLGEMPFEGRTLTLADTYQYGPVCVDGPYRGSGVFEGIFRASLARFRDRYPFMVTFINQVNPRSYAAHTRKAGMKEIGKFDFNGNHYWMMAIRTGTGSDRSR